MKHILLLSLFSLLIFAELPAQPVDSPDGSTAGLVEAPPSDIISIFPNPATDFIGLKNDEEVASIVIFNMVGRPVKRFVAHEGDKYDIAQLRPGFYLVQLLDSANKVLTTQRINKK
jgi:hypothetical protein